MKPLDQSICLFIRTIELILTFAVCHSFTPFGRLAAAAEKNRYQRWFENLSIFASAAAPGDGTSRTNESNFKLRRMWYRDTCKSTYAQFSILNHDDNRQRNALRFNNNHRQRRRQWQRQGFRKLFKNVEHVCILCRFKLNRNSNTFNIDVNVGKLQFGFTSPKLSSSFIRACFDRIVCHHWLRTNQNPFPPSMWVENESM